MKHINKIVFSLALFFAITLQGLAQAPQAISYQAAVRDADGKILANQAVSIKISILQNATNGNAVYVETHALTTNAHGLVNLAIGRGTPVTGTFAAIDWSAAKYYSKMEMDANGGTTYKEVGTSEILSVPYALVAKTVEKAKVPIMTLAELSEYKNAEEGEIIYLLSGEEIAGEESGIYAYDGRQWVGGSNGDKICFPLPTNYSAGEDQYITSGATSTTLNATVTNGTGKWRIAYGTDGGSFDDPTKPNAVFTGLLNVQYKLSWDVYDLCGNEYDSYGNDVIIKFVE